MTDDYLKTIQKEDALRLMGFLEDPFQASADPRFLYLSAQHGDVLRKTQNIIIGARGLATVEGPIGVGKSTIARRLESIYRADPDKNTVIYIYSSKYATEYAALNDISTQLGLEKRKGLVPQWREMEQFLVDQARKDRTVVFILDDVQKMEPDALELIHTLYNFDTSKKLAQVILFGQPEMRGLFMKRPEISNRVSAWFTLNELSMGESLELIRFRCKVAGRDKPLLSQEAAISVSRATFGIPRNIVILMARILDEIAVSNRNPGDGMIPDDIINICVSQYEAEVKRVAGPAQPDLFGKVH